MALQRSAGEWVIEGLQRQWACPPASGVTSGHAQLTSVPKMCLPTENGTRLITRQNYAKEAFDNESETCYRVVVALTTTW